MQMRRVEWWILIVAVLVAAGYGLVWAWAFNTQAYNIYGALGVVPAIAAINAAIVLRVGAKSGDTWLLKVMLAGLAAKFVGTFARYWVAFVVYNRSADASRYNDYAAYQHILWRQGDFVWDIVEGGKAGTQAMEIITTAVYTVIGASPLAGFFVFASFAYWGVYLLYKAFREGVPGGDHRRYALLVFLLPSLLYWPSSIGKESWLLLFVGVAALGVARVFSGGLRGYPLLAIGAVGLWLVRPHLALLAFGSMLVVQLFRPAAARPTGILTKALGVAALVGATYLLLTQTTEFLGIEDLTIKSITDTADIIGERTDQGGSQFVALPLSHPLGVPMAFITLLFRPFLWEASNAQMLAQAIEGAFLAILTIASWPRLRRLPGMLRSHPYVFFAATYVIVFVLAFATFSNFGILARQRTLMLPFFLLLLCLPRRSEDDHAPTARRRRLLLEVG